MHNNSRYQQPNRCHKQSSSSQDSFHQHELDQYCNSTMPTGHGSINVYKNYYGEGSAQQFQYQNHSQYSHHPMYNNNTNLRHKASGWAKGKRSHENVEISPPPSQPTTPAETSLAPKRIFKKHNSVESQNTRPQGSKQPKNVQQQQNAKKQSQLQKTPHPSPQKKKPAADSPAKIQQNQKEQEWNEIFTQTLKLLEHCQPGDEIDILLTYLQPSRASWNKLKEQIYHDLLKLMNPLGVKEILVFGSTLTGLDFTGSDLDYHIQLKIPTLSEEEVKKTILTVSKMSRHYLNPEFRTIYTIQNARVPIIRLLHQHTKITCDINFTSRFGFFNSCFIGQVLSFDERIKGLGVIIKLWSKTHKIAEKMIMSNYCLIILMIFYLQNLEHPMLDTIHRNQAQRAPLILDPKYKWNVFFNETMDKTKENSQSLKELLLGFFEFYQKLNYSNYVLSMYIGELIPRKDFAEHPDLDNSRKIIAECELSSMKIENPQTFIVQDGFELNLNIGIKCKKHVDAFFELLKLSYDKCFELKDEPLSTIILKLLTDIKIPTKQIESKADMKAKKKFQMILHSVAGDLKLCQDILIATDKDKIYSAEDQQHFFFNHVVEGSMKFLKEVYLCTMVSELELSKDSPFKNGFRLSLHVDTVNGRKKMNFKDDATMKAEINLTKKMCEKAVKFDLNVMLTISSKDKGKTVDYEMIDIESNKRSAVLNFGNFFSVNIPTVLKYYLKKKWEVATNNVAEN